MWCISGDIKKYIPYFLNTGVLDSQRMCSKFSITSVIFCLFVFVQIMTAFKVKTSMIQNSARRIDILDHMG